VNNISVHLFTSPPSNTPVQLLNFTDNHIYNQFMLLQLLLCTGVLISRVYILIRKLHLFPSPFPKMIISPSHDMSFFNSYRVLFALILPYFTFVLPLYFPFSLFLSPFFPFSLSSFFPFFPPFFPFFLFSLSSFFPLLLFPFLPFSPTFPPFYLPLFIVFPQMTSADIFPILSGGGGGVFYKTETTG
jgi:hypothetical protein